MNYIEAYEVRVSRGDGTWEVLGTYDREHEAHDHMDRISSFRSGVWRVVRISEVTVGSVAHV